MRFRDRASAGRRLGVELGHLRSEDPLVVAVPPEGVPVGGEVSRVLDAPLGLVGVREVGAPRQPGLVVGAIGADGVAVYDDGLLRLLGIRRSDLHLVERHERTALRRRLHRYLGRHASRTLTGRTVVVVDQDLTSAVTARAACRTARDAGAHRVVLAAPFATRAVLDALEPLADELHVLRCLRDAPAGSDGYASSDPVTDQEVADVLARTREPIPQG